MKSIGRRASFWVLGLVACAALAWGLWLDWGTPRAAQSRELALLEALQALPARPEGAPVADPLRFCSDWSGLPTEALDCRTGLALDALTPARTPEEARHWQTELATVRAEIERLTGVAERLEALPDPARQRSLGVLFTLRQRLDGWQQQWQQLADKTPQALGAADYGQLFQLVLDVRGLSYDAGTNRVRRINWHVARLADAQPAVLARAEQLQLARQALPLFAGLLYAALLALGWTTGRWWGLLLMACFAWMTSLSLQVVADAAMRYGEGSGTFSLNPLGNQLTRQMQVIGTSAALLAAAALLAVRLGGVLQWVQRRWWLALAGMLAAMVGGYLLQGPAMGAEMLKLGMSLLAGMLMAAHGRSVYLSSQWSPASLSPARLLRQWRQPNRPGMDPQDLIAHELHRPLVQAAAFGATGMVLAALVFHDLGAVLVTALVALCLLFFVFGARLTLLVVLALGVVAWALAQTDKVQQRVALMLDPLSASVSDFARLVAFTGAAGDGGFGLGRIAWCNPGGVCVPLQSLSDYMPVVLTGLLGWQWAVLHFAAFMALLVLLGRAMLRAHLTGQGPVRLLALVAFFLLVCTGAQTLITFLGNWRWIPLTGIGAPLLSIGLSSMVTPALAFGLVLAVWSAKGEKP